MSIFIFLVVSYLFLCLALSFLFPKAGVNSSKAWIPGVNFIEWAKIIGKKPITTLWLLFPIVNIFTFCGMAVDMVRSFGNLKMSDSLFAALYAPLKLFLVGKSDDKYIGPILKLEAEYQNSISDARAAKDSYKMKNLVENNPYQKSPGREWLESVFFAVFAAAFIRMFLIEAYVIPTPSMEGSLNVGDFLFVSKAHYGIRPPMTVAMIPLLHNTIPVVNSESYLKSPSLEYHRFPSLEQVEAGKPFVFNWPVGDSVYITKQRPWNIHQATPSNLSSDPELARLVARKDYRVRPVDKRDHYIKRCVAGPGDSLRIINRQIYLNGKPQKNPREMQFLYTVKIPADATMSQKKLEEWGIDEGDIGIGPLWQPGGTVILFLTQAQVDKIKSISKDILVEFYPMNKSDLFPADPRITAGWSVDNYGPIWIPKKGATTQLTLANLPFYRRIITAYEGNSLEIKGQEIFINGQKANNYTFKMNYYWAMGDNRHNSEDSRAWGYVPEDHIVGKPLFIWFSTKEGSISKGINWDRIFTSANKD
jgi:signal peptidase I